jgi:hypothetical protein
MVFGTPSVAYSSHAVARLAWPGQSIFRYKPEQAAAPNRAGHQYGRSTSTAPHLS